MLGCQRNESFPQLNLGEALPMRRRRFPAELLARRAFRKTGFDPTDPETRGQVQAGRDGMLLDKRLSSTLRQLGGKVRAQKPLPRLWGSYCRSSQVAGCKAAANVACVTTSGYVVPGIKHEANSHPIINKLQDQIYHSSFSSYSARCPLHAWTAGIPLAFWRTCRLVNVRPVVQFLLVRTQKRHLLFGRESGPQVV